MLKKYYAFIQQQPVKLLAEGTVSRNFLFPDELKHFISVPLLQCTISVSVLRGPSCRPATMTSEISGAVKGGGLSVSPSGHSSDI